MRNLATITESLTGFDEKFILFTFNSKFQPSFHFNSNIVSLIMLSRTFLYNWQEVYTNFYNERKNK